MAGDRGALDGAGSWARAQPYVDAAWEFLASTALGTAGGWWLDRKLHTQPWLLVAGSVLGFAAGMTIMFRIILNLADRDQAAREAHRKNRS